MRSPNAHDEQLYSYKRTLCMHVNSYLQLQHNSYKVIYKFGEQKYMNESV